MRRRSYSYRPQRSRRGWEPWWLTLPFLLAAFILAFQSRLPAGGGDSLFQDSPAEQPLAVAAPPEMECAVGGACDPVEEKEPPPPPSGGPGPITGAAAVVIEEPCRAVLYDYNSHSRLAPASLTKIATALVAVEMADLSESVAVRVNGPELAARTDSTIMGLEPGQRLSVRDLLYGMMLPSGNDAAIALAEHIAGSVEGFARLMNDKALDLGLADTHFTNPHGLDDPGLYTSAYDIAVMGAELLRDPILASVVATGVYQPAWSGSPVWNGNRLLQTYPGALGVKIGYTDDAGQTIVAAAQRNGRLMVASVLGSSAIYDDAMTMLDWAYTHTEDGCR